MIGFVETPLMIVAFLQNQGLVGIIVSLLPLALGEICYLDSGGCSLLESFDWNLKLNFLLIDFLHG